MDNLKEEYEKITEERGSVLEQLKILEEDEKIKKYLELCEQNRKLKLKQVNSYEQMKKDEYSSCNHIWVYTLQDYDSMEGRSYNYCGCVKCGLDQRVFAESYPEYLPYPKKIMYDFMRKNHYTKGIKSNIFCDLELAQAVYKKIKECNPELDDENLLTFLDITINSIRENIKTDEQKEIKRKEYSLNPKFNKWTIYDISR